MPVTDEQIKYLFENHPGPYSVCPKPTGQIVVDINGDHVLGCNGPFWVETIRHMADHLNQRARELGLIGPAHEIHMEHPFPWLEVHEGEIIDGNGEHVREMHDEPQIADFLVKAANAEARRQGVKFEGGDQ